MIAAITTGAPNPPFFMIAPSGAPTKNKTIIAYVKANFLWNSIQNSVSSLSNTFIYDNWLSIRLLLFLRSLIVCWIIFDFSIFGISAQLTAGLSFSWIIPESESILAGLLNKIWSVTIPAANNSSVFFFFKDFMQAF